MRAYRIGAEQRERIYVSTTGTYDETADLDLIAIEQAVNGERTRLSKAERMYAARFLDSRGLAPAEIAYRIGTNVGTVRNWKSTGWQGGQAPQQPRQERPEPVCGEPRMYRRHLTRGEKPCDACRAANAAADRRYRLTGSTKAVTR
ncbi:terminase gpP N-terminus-related DNA-binding protein [Streptomyces coelicoflavus]|uniref:terminase gpP N-terminus-related DNA-binding protein n=1 Tax=Streptomyces coelicoflavus TaxID=285562 RepID=UPI00363E5A6A